MSFLTQALIVYIVTLFFSFGVQFGFWLYWTLKDKLILKQHKSVVQYSSGIIGDGVLIPLANVFSFEFLVKFVPILNQTNMIVSLVMGTIITFIFHFAQKHFHSTNWTMPQVNSWNTLGLYHAIFMYFESSLLVYSLLTIITNPQFNQTRGFVDSALFNYVAIMFLFFLTFLYDYRKTRLDPSQFDQNKN